jgi:hypothetical protein
MSRRGDNNASTVSPITVEDAGKDRELFDLLPRQIRARLREAKFDYPAFQIWDAFRQVQQIRPDFDKEEIWEAVYQMIDLNDREESRKGYQQYVDLVQQFADEKRARIEAVFQRAS